MKKIEYRDIPDFPGYQAGSDGSIWSSFADGRHDQVKKINGVRYKKLKGCRRKDGYLCVSIRHKSGNFFHFLIHRLILTTFKGPCPEGMESCHKDRDKGNNCIKNLRWDTHASNIKDKFSHGTILRGEQIKQAKLTKVDVSRIRQLADYGVPLSVLGRIWEIGTPEICRIVARQRWANP